MDAADDPRPPATDLPLSIPSSILPTRPGMGIPFELWDHIISFLELEPYPLLACCLTCRCFYEHAERRLRNLISVGLQLSNYTDLDRFVDEIRTIPGKARVISRFRLTGRPSLTFPIVPYRLASQLKNMDELRFDYLYKLPNVPSSTWSLYGHAFCTVVTLTFYEVQFPSFIDFIRLITSFRFLKYLYITSVSCVRVVSPAHTLRSPCKLGPLGELSLFDIGNGGGPFCRSFIHWLCSSRSRTEKLNIDATLLGESLGISLLQTTHVHLQRLCVNHHDSLPEHPTRDYQRCRRKVFSE